MKKTIIITLSNEQISRLNVITEVSNILMCSVAEATDLVKDTFEIEFDTDKWDPDYVRGVFENLNCTVKFKRKSEPKTLKSHATVYPENGYAEFSTFFRVKFTKDVDTKPIDIRALELDIIGTFADAIVRALETRMDSCVCMLMRNSDKVMLANEQFVQFKKNNGQIHVFDHNSFNVMQDTVKALKMGDLQYILNSGYACDQIAKALYWVSEEDRKERNGIGFGRLVSVIINNISREH